MYPDTNAGPPSSEEIAQEAYAIYLHHGGSDGRDVEDWLEAERRLRNRQDQSRFDGSSARDRDANRRAHGGDDLKA
jgi:hypothetical protein